MDRESAENIFGIVILIFIIIPISIPVFIMLTIGYVTLIKELIRFLKDFVRMIIKGGDLDNYLRDSPFFNPNNHRR